MKKDKSNNGGSAPLNAEKIALPEVLAPCLSFTPISQPNAAYQSATTGIADGTSVSSITDGFQTVTFSSPVT
ncbi:hypothetical protein SAMN04488168_11025 [Bacillus sp. 491mf]|nr:hypothetical protein SAMN04488168_11025 [Bacillus sp. 491mf]